MIELDNYELLNMIIALMPGHVYWVDTNSVYQGCNQQQAISAGLKSREEIVGLRNSDLPWNKNTPEIAEKLDRINSAVMSAGETMTIEEPALLANGTRAIFLSSKVPIKDKSRKVVGLVGISIDITEKKRFEEKIQAMLSQKSEILSTIVNEFRTLFQAINLNIERMMDASEISIEQAAIIESIRDACNQKDILLTHASDFAKLETGRLEIQTEEFDLLLLLGDLMLQKSRKLPENVSLYWHNISGAKSIIIAADYTHFRDILSVTIDQAIERTPEGHILLKIAADPSNKKLLHISVIDTSEGYSPQFLKELFSEKAYESSLWGSSINLTYAKKFMEAMQGSYRLESQEEHGVSVDISVPLVEILKTKKTKNEKRCYLILENKIEATALESLLPDFSCLQLPDLKSLEKQTELDSAIILMDENSFNAETFKKYIKNIHLHLGVIIQKNSPLKMQSFDGTRVCLLEKPLLLQTLERKLSDISKVKKILIVEDDYLLRKTVSTILKPLGFQVDEAKNYAETIEKASPIYDCILMDIGLPEMSGIEIAFELKEIFGKACPPMIAFTGLTGTHDLDAVYNCGLFQRVMIKGRIKLQEIAQQIDDVIADSKAAT